MTERLDHLETRVAYQEATLETLGAQLTRQQRRIEQLEATLRMVAARLGPMEPEGASRGSLLDELPPHY